MLSRLLVASLFARRMTAIALVSSAIFAGLAGAQPYPSRPIHVVVPSTTGSNTSLVARVYAQQLTGMLGQPVVVEDRPGAGGAIATQYVKSRPVDGYTLLAMSGTYVTAPLNMSDAGYDAVKDFVGVTRTAQLPLVLVVNTALPVESVKELVAMGKARPGTLSYGSVGQGSFTDTANLLFAKMAGFEPLGVAYKGAAPALMDVLGNRISFMFDTINTSAPHIRSGKLRPLAVSTAERSPVFPQIPTMAEAGVPGYDLPVFNGIVVRTGTAPEIIRRLHAAFVQAAAVPAVRDAFIKDGQQLITSASPEEFDRFVKNEVARFADIAKLLGQ